MTANQNNDFAETQGVEGEVIDDDLKVRFAKEVDAAKGALHDAKDALTSKAGDIASELKEAATEKVAGAQQTIADSLQTIVGALHAAGEHLEESDQARAAGLVRSVVAPVEILANSIRDKPFADVIEEVRGYGQSNPAALVAGSVLAGLALGRFLKSSKPSGGTSGQQNTSGAPQSSRAGSWQHDAGRSDSASGDQTSRQDLGREAARPDFKGTGAPWDDTENLYEEDQQNA